MQGQGQDTDIPNRIDGAQEDFEGAFYLIYLSFLKKTKNHYKDDPAPHADGILDQQSSTNLPGVTTDYTILPPSIIPIVNNLKTSIEFWRALEKASLDNGDLDVDNVYRLRHLIQNEDN